MQKHDYYRYFVLSQKTSLFIYVLHHCTSQAILTTSLPLALHQEKLPKAVATQGKQHFSTRIDLIQ